MVWIGINVFEALQEILIFVFLVTIGKRLRTLVNISVEVSLLLWSFNQNITARLLSNKMKLSSVLENVNFRRLVAVPLKPRSLSVYQILVLYVATRDFTCSNFKNCFFLSFRLLFPQRPSCRIHPGKSFVSLQSCWLQLEAIK